MSLTALAIIIHWQLLQINSFRGFLLHNLNNLTFLLTEERLRLTNIATFIMKMNAMPVTLSQVKEEQICKLNRSAILLFDTVHSFVNFKEKIDVGNRFQRKFTFLTYLRDF